MKSFDLAVVAQMAYVLAAADAAQARIIGVSSNNAVSGHAAVARELAATSSGFGKSTYLVCASEIGQVRRVTPDDNSSDLSSENAQSTEPYLTADLADVIGDMPLELNHIRSALTGLTTTANRIIVTLPSILDESNRARSAYSLVGGACDIVFLVLETGVVETVEAKYCLQISNFANIKLGGVVLNERNSFVGRMLHPKISGYRDVDAKNRKSSNVVE